MRTISKIVKTDVHAVYRWIRAFAEEQYEKPEPTSGKVVIELDEIGELGRLYLRTRQKFLNKLTIIKIILLENGIAIAVIAASAIASADVMLYVSTSNHGWQWRL